MRGALSRNIQAEHIERNRRLVVLDDQIDGHEEPSVEGTNRHH
jgi:hypothetical protein